MEISPSRLLILLALIINLKLISVRKRHHLKDRENVGDFLSGEVDNNGDRSWYGLNLDLVNEVTPKLFMTDDNVWDALIEGYDLANATDGKVLAGDSSRWSSKT